jgi:gluconate 5-dehydrogenase
VSIADLSPAAKWRRGFRRHELALARAIAGDLTDTPVTANILLPGGATATGMIPDEAPAEPRANLLDPAVMGPPIVWLASAAAAGVHDERIVARYFDDWLAAREQSNPRSGRPSR